MNDFLQHITQTIRQHLFVIFMVCLAIFLGNGLNYVGWVYMVQMRNYFILAALCLALSGVCFIQLRRQNISFKYYIIFITFWPLVLLFTTVFNNGDPAGASFIALPYMFVPALFFVYHRMYITEREAVKVLLVVGFLTLIIQILQQIFPFVALFGDLGTGDGTEVFVSTEIRNGIYRFFVGSYQVQLLCLMYCWCKVLQKPRILYIVLTICFLFSIYVYVTKQVLLAAAFAFAVSPFFTKDRRIKISASILFVLLVIAIAASWNVLFANLIKDSQDDGFSHTIRFEFIYFICDYFVNNPLTFMFGHGFDTPLEQDWIRMYYHISDIGFVGLIFYFGCFWTLAYFYIVYIILIKQRRKVPLYIKLYIIASLTMSVFIFPYRDRLECFNWMTILYVASLYIDNHEVLHSNPILQKDILG